MSATFTVSREEDMVIVKVGKYLDFRNADEFRETVLETAGALGDSIGIIVDFEDCRLLDSEGLASLYVLHRPLPMHGRIVCANVTLPVQVVMQLTRSYRVFPQRTDVASAKNYLNSLRIT